MASKGFEVVRYTVSLKAEGPSRLGYPFIRCYSAEVDRPDVTYNYLDILFVSDMDSAPPDQGRIEGDYISGSVYVPAERYAWYLDLLRNESHVYANVDSQYPHQNGIQVHSETVG